MPWESFLPSGRNCYEEVREDTILDDFAISLQIASKGFAIKYAPAAWGTETASVSVHEELKRKVRIACGGWQTLFRMPGLMNIFTHGFLSLKYFSHKVLRWTLVPWAFVLAFILNVAIVWGKPLFSDLYGYSARPSTDILFSCCLRGSFSQYPYAGEIPFCSLLYLRNELCHRCRHDPLFLRQLFREMGKGKTKLRIFIAFFHNKCYFCQKLTIPVSFSFSILWARLKTTPLSN